MGNQHWLIDKIALYDCKQAIICKNKKYTYENLLNAYKSMSHFIQTNKIEEGEVIALQADYSFDSIAFFLALIENKNIIVPIATKNDKEIKERLSSSYVDKQIIIEEDNIKIVQAEKRAIKHKLIQRLQTKKASGLILFSSGSTGKPKAMLHDLDNLLEKHKSKEGRKTNILVFLMFDHIGGVNTLINALSMGYTLTIPERREANYICKIIEKFKVTLLPTSPTFLNLLFISESCNKYDLSSIKLITYGTEPMPENLLKRLQKVFPSAKFLQTFGTSETGITKTSSKSSNSIWFKIHDLNTEYKIIDDELWLKSKTQILGYLNAEMDNFTENGWYKTGDLVVQNDDGYLKIIGRNKEVINIGGQKVMPEEVENALFNMPKIADCIVYGSKNLITGQMVVADIVLENEADPSTIRIEVLKFCKDKLDVYKIPAKINIVDKTNFGNRFKKFRIRHKIDV
jgi:acyl-coenzyme A synthetase/AMP-(fatty) acid ligase